MMAECIVRSFWPIWTVVFFVAAPLLLGWQDVLPLELVWGYAALMLLGFAAGSVFAYRSFRWPTRADAVARVDARLKGRPIETLSDHQAIGAGDRASEALWQAHLQRMQARTLEAKPVEPDLRVSKSDPFGLRFVALLFFVIALAFGSVWRVGTVGEVVGVDGTVLAAGPSWEGWIEPPAYTGKPSLYLADIPEGPVFVPEGSKISLRFYGDVGALTLAETVSARIGDNLPAASDPIQSFTAVQNGTLEISGSGGAAWNVTIIRDRAPIVEVTEELSASGLGELSQPFLARDDYGVISGTASFELDLGAVERRHGLSTEPDPRAPLVVDLPMPFTADRSAFEDVLVEDFSEHPFANLPVKMTLGVADAIGKTGEAPAERFVLPGRRFFQPVARAVIEQRRDLLWSRQNARRVMQMLRAISYRPDEVFNDDTTYLRLSFTLRRMAPMVANGMNPEEQQEIADALWELAILLEDGTLADARERLRRAQERLAEAMRNGATPEEIEELMQELRDATNDYMQMLADQQQAQNQDGTDQPDQQQETFEFTGDELQALMDRIQELMEEGRMAEAQELLEQLNQLMEDLQITQGEGGQGGPQTPGQQSMEDLSDTLRDQQNLSDEAFRDLQDQFNRGNGRQDQDGQGQSQGQQSQRPGQQGQDGQQGEGQGFGQDPQSGLQGDQGQGGEGGEQQSLADRQEALRQELLRQLENLPGLDGDSAEAARRALERAEDAMEGAEDALRNGDLAEAIDRQAEAMDALRNGLRNLGDALAQNQRDEQPGQGQQSGQATGRLEPTERDPLGRQLGNQGQFGTTDNMLQGPDIHRRAEELMQELRRRSSEQERPELELDYLRRLLERF